MLRVVFLFLSLFAFTRGLYKTRFKLTENAVSYPRMHLGSKPSSNIKLLVGADGHIYVGGGQRLLGVNSQADFFQDQDCRITVIQPGRDGYPLFVCTEDGDSTACCYRATNGSSAHCRHDYVIGGEPALLTGDALYTTQSGVGHRNGVYRSFKNTHVMPSNQRDQTYVKIVERRNKQNPLQDKLYAFYTEKNLDQNPDSDIFIPRVSQICMADLGGSKNTLQFQWTSQLSSRLSCGDSSRKLYYTELLDVAVLESEDGQDSRVYGLFTNGWEIRAVCVYAMSDISHVFSTSAFSIPTNSLERRPGECVQNSKQLPSDLLKYMKINPEMEDWVWPIGNSTALLVSHRHYSHIQVDRVGGPEGQEGHNVLLLSMESGAVHKVLENSSEPFIIAEYHPFKAGTPIRSMLLDSSEKKLYVSSSTEVVQIDLRNCSVYGDQCADCVLARDPYCGWDSVHKTCSPYSEDTIQDVENGNFYKCTKGPVIDTSTRGPQKNDAKTINISESSRHYLPCPVHSLHATYHWIQDSMERQSIMDSKQEQLVLLIDGMRSADEGLYQCEAREGDYRKTVVQYELRMISGVATLKSSLALALLLSLILLVL